MYNNSSVRLTELFETASEKLYENSAGWKQINVFFYWPIICNIIKLIILTNKPALNGVSNDSLDVLHY